MNNNPFNFIDPLTLKFPANKELIIISEPIGDKKTEEQYFTVTKRKKNTKPRWEYDMFFSQEVSPGKYFVWNERMNNIHNEEIERPVPASTQSWYGHQKAKYDQWIVMDRRRRSGMADFYRDYELPFLTRPRDQCYSADFINTLKPVI